MNKILEFFIRGIISLIWLVATIVTSVILSPFLLAGWLSQFITKEEKDKSGED
ncbi:hypothetical protein L0657_12490 [Dyadobacter sp. CY345]|uniref:hypothetical protein n=1 Tax=Dyadobacter sp. CY345 TaxID=2909335 RepID=UPI001F219D4B|nr:hypothetical protein [Dyadobacter sp. CY345]MCF2444778.1 hypothetical protein [Dyadobacter sp. CY345]